MIFHTPIMAMLLASGLSSATIVWAAGFGIRVLRHWDIESGSARQLAMERRTHLVSTALVWMMVLELASLLLFVFNADRMSVMFAGSMCAVGTLNANPFGFPALMMKTAVFFGATLWLLVHRVDLKGRDYPLTRPKYGLLIAMAPLALAAAGLQLTYFLGLHADVITSCCSRLFTAEAGSIEAELAAIDPGPALLLLFGGLAVVLGLAILTRRFERAVAVYALAAALFFVADIAATVSAISPYVYEHPHHHCPFCILKPEFSHVGYVIYLPLIAGTAFGLAAGLLPQRPPPASMKTELPRIARRYVAISAGLFAASALVALVAIARSGLVLL
ncbi:MAG: hypothetical protein CME06_13795 [Gemmatimonadetes bacterium]|nr:hypothetical protein [Gemmatimonadota bacterium]